VKNLGPLSAAVLIGLITWIVVFLLMDLGGYAIFHEVHHIGLIAGIYISHCAVSLPQFSSTAGSAWRGNQSPEHWFLRVHCDG